MDRLRAGEPLLKPRLCEHSQGKHRPQLHDPGGKHRLLEDHGGRVLPPAAVVIMLGYSSFSRQKLEKAIDEMPEML